MIKKSAPRPVQFHKVLNRLLAHFGPQHWWPAKSAFEVCVGAILTQNTAWSNVERAITNLKKAKILHPERILSAPFQKLSTLLRPSGYFNIKTHRLRAFVHFYKEKFSASLSKMKKEDSQTLRQELLDVHGVGRETADSILLYALKKPVFVVDAYTRRIFSRHGWIEGDEDYDKIRFLVEKAWKNSKAERKVKIYNEFHALLVMVGKNYCHRRESRCHECPLQSMLPRQSNKGCL